MSLRTLFSRKSLVALTLVVSGAVAGGTAVIATSASADTPSASSTNSHSNETPLTGTTLTAVKDAVLAKYPGATFDRVETDSDGAYEAHITTGAGENLTVELDRAYAITGTETGRGHGRGGRGGGNGETALTGTTLTAVKDAVLAKYPGATFDRVETDSDGAYEAHITTGAGEDLTVELDKDYAITGTE